MLIFKNKCQLGIIAALSLFLLNEIYAQNYISIKGIGEGETIKYAEESARRNALSNNFIDWLVKNSINPEDFDKTIIDRIEKYIKKESLNWKSYNESNKQWTVEIEIGFEKDELENKFSIYDKKEWEVLVTNSGDNLDCNDNNTIIDIKIENFLEIQVGLNANVMIKVIGKYSNQCYRFIYIKAGDTQVLKNFPYGDYYLKIAYGKNLIRKNIFSNCFYKFLNFPLYEKGEDGLRFGTTTVGNEIYNVCYKLYLDVEKSDDSNNFDSIQIDEREFNK